MKIISEITDQYKQTLTIVNEDNSTFLLSLNFSSQQKAWFYGITYGNFSSDSQRLVVAPNILRRQKNILPFGISIASTDGGDPFLLNDFVSGRITLLLLTSEEVAEVETIFFSPSLSTNPALIGAILRAIR